MDSKNPQQIGVPAQITGNLFIHTNPACDYKIGTDYSADGTEIRYLYVRKAEGKHDFIFASKKGLQLLKGSQSIPVIETFLTVDVTDEEAIKSLFDEFGFLLNLNSEDYVKIPLSKIQSRLLTYQSLVNLINEVAKLDRPDGNYPSVISLIFDFLLHFPSKLEPQGSYRVANDYTQTPIGITTPNSNTNPPSTTFPMGKPDTFFERLARDPGTKNYGWPEVSWLQEHDQSVDPPDEPIDISDPEDVPSWDSDDLPDEDIDIDNYTYAYYMTDSIMPPPNGCVKVTDVAIDYASMHEHEDFQGRIQYLYYTKNEGEDFLNGIIDLFYHLHDYREDNRSSVPLAERNDRDQWEWIGKLDNKRIAANARMCNKIQEIASAIIKYQMDYNLYGKIQPEYNTETLTSNWKVSDLNTALYLALFFRDSKANIYRKCANPSCGNYFTVPNTNTYKQYCCDECSNLVRQRAYAAKKRLKKTKVID